MPQPLKILLWPDPRLKKISLPVKDFDSQLAELSDKMFQLMREFNGVGLAAPQVGVNLRMFVTNTTGEPSDARAYVNPQLSSGEGEEEGEEGCLSLPGIHVNVVRHKTMRIQAHDLKGNAITETASGFVARVWQHELDHLNGTLLTDRMGPVAKMTHRRLLKELREQYERANPPARKQTGRSRR